MNGPLYVGPATQARCRDAHLAVAQAKITKDTLKEVAADFGVTPSTLQRMCEAHATMGTYEVTLEREGSASMTVCTVITPKGALAAAVAAFREYAGTLKGLELPGWKLRVNDVAFDLHDVRAEAARNHARAA